MSLTLSLSDYAKQSNVTSKGLGDVLLAIGESAVQCAASLRSYRVSPAAPHSHLLTEEQRLKVLKAASGQAPNGEVSARVNRFGDEVLTIDLLCDSAISRRLSDCPAVVAYASEENPELTRTPHGSKVHAGTGFTVAFDPLDGSSIVDSNFSVGSIFGVWPGEGLVGRLVGEMHAAVMVVYGSRTTMFVATASDSSGVRQFLIDHDDAGASQQTEVHSAIRPIARYFSPGNLRATNDLPWYHDLITGVYMRKGITLRYTGGMVPDVAQIFVKGSGIFMTPVSMRKKVKLRVCFECGPIAFLVEKAGGASVDCTTVKHAAQQTAIAQAKGCEAGRLAALAPPRRGLPSLTFVPPSPYSYLYRVIGAVDERSALAVGSKTDVLNYSKCIAEGQTKLIQSKL